MAVLATHLRLGVDFVIDADADSRDVELTQQLYGRCAGTTRPGRELVECREHDQDPRPEYVARRDPKDERVHGIYIYLQKRNEGTPEEKWVVCHFNGEAAHIVRGAKSVEHQREQDEWCTAGDAAGWVTDQEVRLPSGNSHVVADVLIHGPVALVDIEVQRRHQTVSTAQSRTRKITAAGATPIWSTDHSTLWTEKNSVPHIRTNDLAGLVDAQLSPRDSWLIVGGARDVQAEQCLPENGSKCPVKGLGKFCKMYHPRLVPAFRLRAYDVAERVPAGDLVPLYAGRKQGWSLVPAKARDLWNELCVGQTDVLIPQQRPPVDAGGTTCSFVPGQGFGVILDERTASPIVTAADTRKAIGPSPCACCGRWTFVIADWLCMGCRWRLGLVAS